MSRNTATTCSIMTGEYGYDQASAVPRPRGALRKTSDQRAITAAHMMRERATSIRSNTWSDWRARRPRPRPRHGSTRTRKARTISSAGGKVTVKTDARRHCCRPSADCLQRLHRGVGAGDTGAHVMPIRSFIGATVPLGDDSPVIPGGESVDDSRFVVRYFRKSADGRLLVRRPRGLHVGQSDATYPSHIRRQIAEIYPALNRSRDHPCLGRFRGDHAVTPALRARGDDQCHLYRRLLRPWGDAVELLRQALCRPCATAARTTWKPCAPSRSAPSPAAAASANRSCCWR
jgi:hypothetical protein